MYDDSPSGSFHSGLPRSGKMREVFGYISYALILATVIFLFEADMENETSKMVFGTLASASSITFVIAIISACLAKAKRKEH